MFSARIQNIPDSGIRVIFNRALEIERQGHRVYHLEVGRPDWKLPPGAADGVSQAIRDGYVNYIANRGLLELRQSIGEDLEQRTGRKANAETEIIVTLGGSEGVAMCALALLNPGDEVIIPEPAWPHYRAVTQLADAQPVSLPLSYQDGYLLDPDFVAKNVTSRTKLLILNSPNNPTGAVQSKECLEEIARLAEKHGFYILSDEVYQDFVYQNHYCSMAEIMGESDRLILLNSFSKSYAMTGWRLGYIVSSPSVSKILNRAHQYLTVCGVAFAQKGASKILSHPERETYLQQMKDTFWERFNIWKNALSQCPCVSVKPPAGAFYLFPLINYRGMSGREFCQYMLDEHHIAMVPGEIFGEDFGQHVRISYGRDTDIQTQASQKFVEILNG